MKITPLASKVASLCLCAPLFTSPFVNAQDDPVELQVTYSANRFEQTVDSVIAPVTVVTEKEIKASQAKSISEVLRTVPGVEITQSGGLGHTSSIFMRGSNSSHTLVLVDGIRLNNSIGAGINFNRIPVAQIERIEVVRGSASAMYGSDAIGGVINIITRSKKGSNGSQVGLGMGSDNYFEGDGVARVDVGENGHLKIAAGFQQTDGYNINPVPGENDGEDYGFDGNQLMLNYEHELDKNWSLYGSYRWFNNNSEYNYQDWMTLEYNVATSNIESKSYTLQLSYDSDIYKSFLTLNYQNDLSEDTIKSDTVISLLDITQSNIQWANLWQVSDILSVNTGADWHREELGDDAISYLGSMAGEERDNVGVYLSPTVELDDLTLQASARFDKHDKYDDYFAWMLGGKYYLSDSQSVSAKYNTSFKAPDYYSLSTSPDLQPEEAKSFELAWNGNFSIANVHVTAYQSDIENLQIWYNDPSAPWGGYLENVDADIRGLELEVNFYTGPVSHQLFADLKNHEDDLGQPLARRADHSFSWKGRVNLDQFDISASLKYVGERTDLSVDPDEEQIKLDAYVIADIAGSYQINQNLSVGGRVDNLFNEQYETAGGYPAADRTYYANVNYSF